MCSCATYYFDSNKNEEGSAKVMIGVKWAYTKNAGSLAFGALIHGIIVLIREIVD